MLFTQLEGDNNVIFLFLPRKPDSTLNPCQLVAPCCPTISTSVAQYGMTDYSIG